MKGSYFYVLQRRMINFIKINSAYDNYTTYASLNHWDINAVNAPKIS